MKLGWIFFTALFVAQLASAQLTLDKHYDYSANTVKINDTEYKLYLMDVAANQCRIYNPDHSLYKTINLAVPANNYLSDIKFVSQDMFNTDSQIELLYTYYSWISTDNQGNGYYEYNTKVVNESGTVLLDAPKVVYAYIKEHSAGVYKLYLYGTDYSAWPYKVWTDIYNLPGKVQTDVITKSAQNSVKSAYPNPASTSVTLSYAMQQGATKGIMKILNAQGTQIAQYEIDNYFDNLILPVEGMAKGTYLYFVEYENHTKSEAMKFLVQ
jgi:hypothetical protein